MSDTEQQPTYPSNIETLSKAMLTMSYAQRCRSLYDMADEQHMIGFKNGKWVMSNTQVTHSVDEELDEAMGQVLTRLENAVEHSTAARMNGRTTSNRMIHANALTELSDLVTAHLDTVCQAAVREAVLLSPTKGEQ